MPNHSPAPWHVIKRDNRFLGSVHYAIETVNKLPEHPWSTRLVCWMAGTLGDSLPSRKVEDARTDPDIEADAYLMAAAPEMYAALKATADEMMLADFDQNEGTYQMVLAALAKAENAE